MKTNIWPVYFGYVQFKAETHTTIFRAHFVRIFTWILVTLLRLLSLILEVLIVNIVLTLSLRLIILFWSWFLFYRFGMKMLCAFLTLVLLSPIFQGVRKSIEPLILWFASKKIRLSVFLENWSFIILFDKFSLKFLLIFLFWWKIAIWVRNIYKFYSLSMILRTFLLFHWKLILLHFLFPFELIDFFFIFLDTLFQLNDFDRLRIQLLKKSLILLSLLKDHLFNLNLFPQYSLIWLNDVEKLFNRSDVHGMKFV